MARKKQPSRVELAARLYGCEVGDLMAYYEFEDGPVAIIAPSGQKFVYPAERILQERDRQMDPASRDSKEARTQKAPGAPRTAVAGMAKGGPDVKNVPDQVEGDEETRARHAKEAPAVPPGEKTGV